MTNPYAALLNKRVKVTYPEITYKGVLMGYNKDTNLLALKNVKWSDNGKKFKEPFLEVFAADALVSERISKEAKLKAFIHNPLAGVSLPKSRILEEMRKRAATLGEKMQNVDNLIDEANEEIALPEFPPPDDRNIWLQAATQHTTNENVRTDGTAIDFSKFSTTEKEFILGNLFRHVTKKGTLKTNEDVDREVEAFLRKHPIIATGNDPKDRIEDHNPVDFSKPEHHLSEPLKSHFADVCRKASNLEDHNLSITSPGRGKTSRGVLPTDPHESQRFADYIDYLDDCLSLTPEQKAYIVQHELNHAKASGYKPWNHE